MRLTRKLALVASLALALVAATATVALATSAQVDPTETATTITSNGADPSGTYVAYSASVVLTAGTTVPVQVNCASRSRFTLQADGTGEITRLLFLNCTSGINSCIVNGTGAGNTTAPVTIGNGRFTITGDTVDPTRATFVLATGTGLTLAEISGTVTCSAISLDCRFTTPTGDDSGTVPFSATVEEGDPATFSFTNSTIDGDTDITCANPDMTGTYTLDDPTTGNTGYATGTTTTPATGGTGPTITDPDAATVSP